MFDGYEVLTRLNAEALRRCEEDFLDPDSDYGCYTEDEEDEEAEYD